MLNLFQHLKTDSTTLDPESGGITPKLRETRAASEPKGTRAARPWQSGGITPKLRETRAASEPKGTRAARPWQTSSG